MIAFTVPHALVVATQWLIAYGVVLWLAVAWAVVRDAMRRSSQYWFYAIALVLGLLPPFLGAIIYWIIRPSSTRVEQETQALEQTMLREAGGPQCPTCSTPVHEDFLLCPVCRTRLARACRSCAKPVDVDWKVCPYCETPVEEAGSKKESAAGTV